MLFVVLVYQPGDFLRIFNLRAIPGCSKVPGLSSSQTEEVDHLAFYLHGGTTYGRGIRILPESSPDIQKLKRYGRRRGSILNLVGVNSCWFTDEDAVSFFFRGMEPLLQHNELNDSELLEIWCTPPQSPPGEERSSCFLQEDQTFPNKTPKARIFQGGESREAQVKLRGLASISRVLSTRQL